MAQVANRTPSGFGRLGWPGFLLPTSAGTLSGMPVDADLVLRDVTELVTCEAGLGEGALGVIERGALAAASERIVWVGPESRLDAEVRRAPGAVEIDGRGRVALPGFVDSHTHAVFAGSREQEYALRARGASYQEIAAAGGGILSTVKATRAASVDELVSLARPRLATLLAHGTTTVEIKSGYGLTTADEIKMLEAINRLADVQAVEVHANFCGAHEVPPEYKGRTDAYVDLVIEEMLPAVFERRLARYIDVFCEEGRLLNRPDATDPRGRGTRRSSREVSCRRARHARRRRAGRPRGRGWRSPPTSIRGRRWGRTCSS